MFYKRGTTWFEWNTIVDVVPAPIAANRLYMTGDGEPKIVLDGATVYPLAVKSPASALSASVTGTPDPATQATVIYAYTYVTAFDEESAPSPSSNEVLRSGGMNVTLTGFVAPPDNRNYNRIRIYRSQTSASGVTDFYFIAEVVLPVPTPSWIDVVEDNPIQEPITSLNYDPPPSNLTGIISLPNGMLAGFVGKKLYFSEPWLPHAWPEKYVQTTNFDIVGLGSFGSSVAVMTTGQPYVVSGTTPDQMIMEQLEVNYPCVNKRGIVDLGYVVAYPSTDGLVTISSAGAQIATRQIISREKWLKMSPDTFISAQYDGRYVACYNYTNVDGSNEIGSIIIDLTGEQPFIVRVDMYSDYLFFEIGAGKLYGVNGQIATEWDSLRQSFMNVTWRSKKFVHSGHVNFGAILADTETLQVGIGDLTALPFIVIEDATFVTGVGDSGAFGSAPSANTVPFGIRVYADGNLISTVTKENAVARLPAGFLAKTWEIEITGERMVTGAFLAWSPSELAIVSGGSQ